MQKTLLAAGLILGLAIPVFAGNEGGEPPHWPYGFDLPEALRKDDAKKRQKKRILVWVPEGTERVRAALLIVANSDSKHFGEHDATRRVAAKHDMGVVYLRYALQNRLDRVPDVMAKVAEGTRIEEFAHVPWITFGKSSMGKFPYYMAWKYPKRTVATISYHAETPKWPMADWSNLDDHTVLHVSANGEVEWGGTWAKHVRPSLLNYRANTGLLAHQVVARDVGHGDYVDAHGSSGWGKSFPGEVTVQDVWDYLALYVDKALSLRLPKGAYPTDGPLQLRTIDPSIGLLVEPFAVEDVFQRPRMDLVETGGEFVVAPEKKTTTNGYAEIAPAEGYEPADGVPLVEIDPPRSPTQWLVTKGLGGYAVETDPMSDVSAFADLRPKPGDTVKVGEKEAAFQPLADKEIGRREGIERGMAMKGGLQPKNKKITVVGYTVLDVKEPGAYKVVGYHSLAVRLQIVLNGRPVDHNQVVVLEKGLYPMLFVLRMKSVTWGHTEPALATTTEQEVAEAKAVQVKKDRKEAEFEARFADGRRDPASFIHPYDEVDPEKRKRMFWLPDKDLAEAWLKLHTP